MLASQGDDASIGSASRGPRGSGGGRSGEIGRRSCAGLHCSAARRAGLWLEHEWSEVLRGGRSCRRSDTADELFDALVVAVTRPGVSGHGTFDGSEELDGHEGLAVEPRWGSTVDHRVRLARCRRAAFRPDALVQVAGPDWTVLIRPAAGLGGGDWSTKATGLGVEQT